MIDLHLHLLPGVDDGARSLAEAVAMARIARQEGCTALVATPHQRRDEWTLPPPAILEQLLARIEEQVPGLALYLGAEVRVDSDLGRELARPGRSGILPLAGSSYLLLEFDPEGFGPNPLSVLEEVGALGYRAIVAHPELLPPLLEPPGLVERMVEGGAALQVTAGSLVGEFGPHPRRVAWELLEAGLVSLVASDAHREDWRPPGLREVFQLLESRIGSNRAEALVFGNPACVLQDRPIPVEWVSPRRLA